jgi:hypothetical protein
VHEFLREVDWKAHRAPLRFGTAVRDNLACELADATKYLWSLWQEAGFDADEMLASVASRSETVWARWHQETEELDISRPVLLLDLDGSVADFAAGLLR